MRIDIKRTEVYPFDELSDDAKQTAIEQLASINIDCKWWEGIFEDAEQVGIELTEFDIDRGSFCHGKMLDSYLEIASRIRIDHGAGCETCKTACAFLIDVAKIRDDEIEESEEAAEFERSILEDYRIMLQKKYEYETSRKAVIKTIEINEYEFTIDGKIYGR